MTYENFYFDSYDFDRASGQLTLAYHYDSLWSFTETIDFGHTYDQNFVQQNAASFDAIFRLIFLLCGVSYAKAFVPKNLICTPFAIDRATADFVEKIYHKGLAEFAYRNQLNLAGKLKFLLQPEAQPQEQPQEHPKDKTQQAPSAPVLPLNHAHLVPVGGGKDSALSIEILKNAGLDVTLFALSSPAGLADPIAGCIKIADRPVHRVTRSISKNLMQLNKQSELRAYNGHVPITAILSAIAVATAMLHQMDTVVMSNESSANSPTLTVNSWEINHQYSKSLEFERDLAHYIHTHIAQNFHYFSLLRPLSEVAIAARFAALTPYHAVFRSCNAAFKQSKTERAPTWCCDCPKCRFVFLALAPFLTPQKIEAIFGRNMLDDAGQYHGFAELCGLAGHKPFECVGEEAESTALITRLASQPDWQKNYVVERLSALINLQQKAQQKQAQNSTKNFDDLFALSPDHLLPPAYFSLIEDLDSKHINGEHP
ncbi:MAG: endonuclease domain-containing protein [Alphaproteobacteria bacterium]|nr:endonuclease domain-containing protein [Alphaproteobacteria bacterium]